MKKWFVVISVLVLVSLLPVACGSIVSATPSIGSRITADRESLKMVYVPQGEFTMGLGDRFVRNPAHKVILDSYWIDQTEVTNAMYAKCVAEGACKEPADKSSSTRSSYYGNSEFNDYPVIYVDWKMAKNYCEWRGDKLPTEAQWEKAARGTDGRIYPWGENIDCYFVNYYWISPDYDLWESKHYCVGDTTRVGSYESGKSPYGLYDMIGNVSEWVADWDGAVYEPDSILYNPAGPDTGVYRMTRGGSWRDSSLYSSSLPLALSVISNTLSAFDTKDDLGFRCVRDTPP